MAPNRTWSTTCCLIYQTWRLACCRQWCDRDETSCENESTLVSLLHFQTDRSIEMSCSYWHHGWQ
jgi:hypothetical protein